MKKLLAAVTFCTFALSPTSAYCASIIWDWNSYQATVDKIQVTEGCSTATYNKDQRFFLRAMAYVSCGDASHLYGTQSTEVKLSATAPFKVEGSGSYALLHLNAGLLGALSLEGGGSGCYDASVTATITVANAKIPVGNQKIGECYLGKGKYTIPVDWDFVHDLQDVVIRVGQTYDYTISLDVFVQKGSNGLLPGDYMVRSDFQTNDYGLSAADLTVVPEPCTLALLASGLASLLLRSRGRSSSPD